MNTWVLPIFCCIFALKGTGRSNLFFMFSRQKSVSCIPITQYNLYGNRNCRKIVHYREREAQKGEFQQEGRWILSTFLKSHQWIIPCHVLKYLQMEIGQFFKTHIWVVRKFMEWTFGKHSLTWRRESNSKTNANNNILLREEHCVFIPNSVNFNQGWLFGWLRNVSSHWLWRFEETSALG